MSADTVLLVLVVAGACAGLVWQFVDGAVSGGLRRLEGDEDE